MAAPPTASTVVATRDAEGRGTLRLAGVFDAAAARRLCASIAAAPRDARVLDFAQVHTHHDVALEMLARALREASGRIGIVGLAERQRRMLRYFGAPLSGRPEAGGAGDLEDPLR